MASMYSGKISNMPLSLEISKLLGVSSRLVRPQCIIPTGVKLIGSIVLLLLLKLADDKPLYGLSPLQKISNFYKHQYPWRSVQKEIKPIYRFHQLTFCEHQQLFPYVWWIKRSESNGQTENYDHAERNSCYEFIELWYHAFDYLIEWQIQ
jgi:hypothetical protein